MLTPAQLQAGREWLAECEFRDADSDYILNEATPEEVVKNVARTYDGGWHGFLLGYEPPVFVFGEPSDREFEPRDYNDADGVTIMGDLQ